MFLLRINGLLMHVCTLPVFALPYKRLELKYPIILGVSDVLHGKIQPREGLMGLMRQPLMREMYEDYSHP